MNATPSSLLIWPTKVAAHHDVLVEEVTSRIDTELAPYADAVQHLVTVPGIDRKGAAVIIAETGGDMSRFPSAAHLASWAGVCPGSHESGGVRKSGTRRNGNKALGAALGNAAMGAARTKNSYLRERYYRLAARRGNNEPSSRSSTPCSPQSGTCS